jgi:hypothetical protein
MYDHLHHLHRQLKPFLMGPHRQVDLLRHYHRPQHPFPELIGQNRHRHQHKQDLGLRP